MPSTKASRNKRQVDALLERSRTAIDTSRRLLRQIKQLSKEWAATRAELHRYDGKTVDLWQPASPRKRKTTRQV